MLHRRKAARKGQLECWTSAIEADVYRTGELVSKRMDVLISRDFRVSKGQSFLHFPPRSLYQLQQEILPFMPAHLPYPHPYVYLVWYRPTCRQMTKFLREILTHPGVLCEIVFLA